MTRWIYTIGCCLLALVLAANGFAAEQSTSETPEINTADEQPEQLAEQAAGSQEAQKPEPKAETPEQAAEKAEKPEPKVEKPEPKAEKPEPKAERPEPKAQPAEQPAPKPQPKPSAEKPATVKAMPELFKIDISLKGIFEGQSATEIVLRPEAWTAFKVVKAVAHGAEVKQGDTLVVFDAEDLDLAISDLRAKIELGAVALKQAEEGLRILEATTPLDLAAAERSKRRQDEDAKRYAEIERPMRVKSANFNVETSENYLQYEQEELRQLEKMYKADEITEETEEIILKRQRDAVKRAQFYLELDKLQRDEILGITLPRLDESMKERTVRQGLSLEQAKTLLPLALQQSRLDTAKLKDQLAKDRKKLADLEADRKLIELKSPVEGKVYYGRFNRGQWSGAAAGADKLRKDGSVTPGEVFMSIVRVRPLVIRVDVPEKDIQRFRPGLQGRVEPTGFPDLRLSAVVSQVDAIPFTAGTFEALLRVNVGDDAQALMPGMGCTVKFTPYLKKTALVVPPSAVKTDELDDQKHYVYVLAEDGRQVKQQVTVGQRTADKVEILDGLVAGNEVLKEFPKDKQ